PVPSRLSSRGSNSAVLPGRTWNVTRVSIICDLRKSCCAHRHGGDDARDERQKPREIYGPHETKRRADDAGEQRAGGIAKVAPEPIPAQCCGAFGGLPRTMAHAGFAH